MDNVAEFEPVDQEFYKTEVRKNELVFDYLAKAKELQKLSKVSWDDALLCVKMKREFWLAASEEVSKNGRSFGLVASCVNFRLQTKLDFKMLPKVFRYFVPEFREWEESVRAPKRKAREALLLEEMSADDLQKFTMEKTLDSIENSEQNT